MPYIKPPLRYKIYPHIEHVVQSIEHICADDPDAWEGVLNYTITSLMMKTAPAKLRYRNMNAMVGVLECAKMELYRRVAAPYEDDAKSFNGDVYPE